MIVSVFPLKRGFEEETTEDVEHEEKLRHKPIEYF